MAKEWEQEEIGALLRRLQVDSEQGLSEEEAQRRLEEQGENSLREHEVTIWLRLPTYFWGPIPWMIEVAMILSAYLRHWPDFIVISALLLFNAVLGFIQEYKASHAIAALRRTLAMRAQVLRGGRWQEIPASQLVVGDIVSMAIGSIVPADIRLLTGEYLSVDQSALTGESLPVGKKEGDPVYSSTIVKMGEMSGVVTATGKETYLGQTAHLVSEAQTLSHFHQAVVRIGNFLIFLTLGVAVLIFIDSLLRVELFDNHQESLGSLLIYFLIVVVAGIPVALPAVLSMTMAIGARRMASMQAIVSRLSAVEELASLELLFSDKTGTLTQNQLTVGEIECIEGKSEEEVLFVAALASSRKKRDAIDSAIVTSLKDASELEKYEVKRFVPFDPNHKRCEATLQYEGQYRKVCKGAPQVIAGLAKLEEALAQKVHERVLYLASHGYRTLGVAEYDEGAGRWSFLGLIPIFDPPREDTAETVDHLHNLGITIKMVTGDNRAIARETSSKLHLGKRVWTASKLLRPDSWRLKPGYTLDDVDGFAEVLPEHKFQLVREGQSEGRVVGMTGDGVNDAPALKQADIGIAVSNATDAARSAADLVLTAPGLMVIARGIEEARRIFARMRNYAIYRISETCRLLFFLLLAVLIYETEPLTAIMIILIALLNDVPIMMIAYDNVRCDSKPSIWRSGEIYLLAIGLALVGVVSTFGLYWIGGHFWGFSPPMQQTLSFFAILCGGNLTIYLTRNRGWIWDRPWPEWKFFGATMVTQVVGTLVAVYGLDRNDFVGVGWYHIGLSWIYILVWLGICMLTKSGLVALIDVRTRDRRQYLHQVSERLHSQ